MEHKSQTFVNEEFEKNTKGHEKGVSADLRDPFRTLTEDPHKCVLSPELQECMDRTKGALLRAHTAEEAAKPPKVLGSEPGAN